ncbi:hypothetical protein HPB48_019378 [Haemaphysalis longicornis]|uniref:Alpha-2-macroglobulin bait region domain-containing protein n=1 Tax=Haemaphysalis longicornis TaxID=44386 RepID=A0A9J6G516_HAELO|nr:hypothetical protein HPB48_019378 [Haemaphysalis longicornis]
MNVAFKQDLPTPVDENFLVEEDLNETLPSNMAEGSVPTGSFEFELEPDYNHVPRVKVLAFYVRPDGEVIADTEQFEVDKCLQNNVTMKFGSETVQPATSAAIHVNGSPRSYCGVGVVDKSVHLLKQDNQLTKDKVYDILKRLDITRYTWPKQASYEYCRKQLAKNPTQFKRNIWNGPRSSNVEYVDSITAFDESGVVVMSDLTLETRPCRKNIYDRPPYALAAPARPLARPFAAALPGPPPPPLAFSNRVVGGPPGVAAAAFDAPPPVGFSSDNIPAKSAVEIDLKLAESADYLIEGESETTLCVCGSKSQVHKFTIRPQTIGEVNLTVSAAGSQNDVVCGDKPTEKVVARDAVTRPLIIEAEGFPKEETKSVFVCPKDAGEEGAKHEFDLVLPEDLVEGSARAYVSVTGNEPGQGSCCELLQFKGVLEHLLKYQNSCLLLGTNFLFCLALCLGNFSVSYYGCTSNSELDCFQKFPYFPAPFKFLAYFVAQHVFTDNVAFAVSNVQSMIQKVSTLIRHSYEARHWRPKPFHRICLLIQGKVNSTAPGALTAYVLTALLEGGLADAKVVETALRCISAQRDPSAHNLALSAYAAALAGHDSAKEYLEKLETLAINKGGLTYWSNAGKKGPSASADVETAAYAVLAYLKLNAQENLSKAQPIVRWMATKRNSRGGFPSTQDTVLGLQALSAFATHVSKDPVDIAVKVEGTDVSESYNLKEDTKLVVQEKKVVNLPNKLTSEASGPGCALVSLYREKDVKLKRHEIEKNQVNLYFEEYNIVHELLCFVEWSLHNSP